MTLSHNHKILWLFIDSAEKKKGCASTFIAFFNFLMFKSIPCFCGGWSTSQDDNKKKSSTKH